MRRNAIIAGLMFTILLTGWLLSGCGSSQSADAAVTVDGKVISKEEVDRRISLIKVLNLSQSTGQLQEYFEQQAAKAQGSTIPPEVVNRLMADQLATGEIDRLEAEERGITVSDEEIEAAAQEVVEDRYLGYDERLEADFTEVGLTMDDLRHYAADIVYRQKIVDSLKSGIEVSDEEVLAAYQERKNSFVYPEKRQIRQIVTHDEATAQSVANRLAAGENMSVLVSELSTDAQSRAKGGRSDLALKEQLPPEVGEVAFSLQLDQISRPFKSGLGWYVIRVEVINNSSSVTFDEAKERIRTALLDAKFNQRQTEYEKEVKEKYDLEYAEGFKEEIAG